MPEEFDDHEEPTRRSIAGQKEEFLREYYKAVREENEPAFSQLLRAWRISEGSNEERLAWEAFWEEIASRKRKRPAKAPRPRP
jgi:hypothetical protein